MAADLRHDTVELLDRRLRAVSSDLGQRTEWYPRADLPDVPYRRDRRADDAESVPT